MSTPPPRHKQRGVALLLLLFLAFGLGTTIALSAWNSSRTQSKREQATEAALQLAKEALIGAAIADDSQPGILKCPEDLAKLATEGQAQTSCSAAGSLRLGRFPWKTLMVDRLVDGFGEPLWYAVSQNFTKPPVNTTTIGDLQVDGIANAAIAVIVAPGPPLPGQIRSMPSMASPPQPINYLDLSNAGGLSFTSKGPVGSLNDRIITITATELSNALKARALAEIRGVDDLTGGLRRYYNDHGNQFPWADTNGDGVADVGQMIGSPPRKDLTFDTKTKSWLTGNNWFSLVNYSRLSANSAQVSIGSLVLKVQPCTQAPCP
jgi:type II secretory pathway pseudopilin PulG